MKRCTRDLPVTIKCVPQEEFSSRAWVVEKLRRVAANQHRRGPSATRHKAFVCDRCERRFAQDDDFVEVESMGLGMQEHGNIEKVTGSRDDGFVGALKQEIQNQLALKGHSPFLRPIARVLAHRMRAWEESVFGPCTLGRTWGTRPGSSAA